MKYLFYLFILLIVLIVTFLFYSGVFKERKAGEVLQQWETKMDDQPPVTVKVTPVEFGKDSQTWRFRIVFDTHSGSLDDDLLQVAVLVSGTNKTYRPTSWEGAGPGGHHREGVLIFDAINPMPSSVELKIKNVGGVPERSFIWNIK